MKYGSQFERESVPAWSFHNLDYNALKHHIKVHTTRDQATALVIPGQQDQALQDFEGELFAELCRQHARVGLFVSSKADEIARRIEHLTKQTHPLTLRCPTSTIARDVLSSKELRKLAKYEHALLQCGDDIQALERFVDAQVIAFRKILKKYRKWTGSAALGRRFKDVVLSNPKSFTKRSFFPLHTQYEASLSTLRVAKSDDAAARPFKPNEHLDTQPSTNRGSPSIVVNAQPAQQKVDERHAGQLVSSGYWNEYDDGSEVGDIASSGEGYVIYVNPDDPSAFPGIDALMSAVASPFETMRTWLKSRTTNTAGRGERQSLLPSYVSLHGTLTRGTRNNRHGNILSHSPGADSSGDSSDPDTESEMPAGHRRRSSHGYASSEDFPAGYATHYAAVLPSINEQRLTRHRESVLAWGTAGCYAASALFLTVAAILVMAGRHRLRVEVDTGVTLGVMASLGCACAGLAMTLSRCDALGFLARLFVWVVFAVLCASNGVMLLLVMGNSSL